MIVDYEDGLMNIDAQSIRDDFPTLYQQVFDHDLVYLDTAASAQTPRMVLEAMTEFYMNDYSNVHRGVHTLSQIATENFESARVKVQRFINAHKPHEVIFTRGTTESLNMLAQSFGKRLKAGDEIILSVMEHHANIVPWQMLRDQTGIELKICPITEKGELDMAAFEALLTDKTVLLSLIHTSNVLGTINPAKAIIELAHAKNIPVCLDGAQSVANQPVDVQALDVDFYVFSGHKLYGPTGVGVLYGKEAWLEQLEPVFGGGSMIETVSFDKTTYAKLPMKFEPGTPPIAEVIGLGAAIDYLNHFGMDNIFAYEENLTQYALSALQNIDGVKIYGDAEQRGPVISFTVDGIHAHDLGTIFDQEGVAVRAGHHCCMPLMTHLGVAATVRASFAIYNTTDDADALARAIMKAKELFGV